MHLMHALDVAAAVSLARLKTSAGTVASTLSMTSLKILHVLNCDLQNISFLQFRLVQIVGIHHYTLQLLKARVYPLSAFLLYQWFPQLSLLFCVEILLRTIAHVGGRHYSPPV